MMEVKSLEMDGGSTTAELAGRRSRIMTRLQTNLKQHPASEQVKIEMARDENDLHLQGDFDTSILVEGLVEADSAKIIVNWWPHPVGIDDHFKFHYIESTGYDCGWHRQPHPDEREIPFDHFQQRAPGSDEYQYQPVDFKEDTPIGLLWEISWTRLPRILKSRWR